MSDDAALAWKMAFGALVLAFCAVVMIVRKPAATLPVTSPAPAVIQPLPLLEPPRMEPASAPEAAAQTALDVQEDSPVHIEVRVFDPPRARAAAKPRPAARPAAAKRSQQVAKRPAKSPVLVASAPRPKRALAATRLSPARPPVQARAPHYPFNPHERWARAGDIAFAPGR